MNSMKVFLSLLIIILAILGLADASYLTYEKFSGAIPVCGEGFDCGAVLQSPYSQIGPVPLSLLGALFYSTVLLAGIDYYLQSGVPKKIADKLNLKLPFVDRPEHLLLFLTSFGFGFSIYLVSLMGLVIQSWCLFCLLSAATSTSLFVVASALTISNKKTSAHQEKK